MSPRIVLSSTGEALATEVEFAATFRARAKGLLGREGMPPGHCLVLPRSHQVHTFGMLFPIDVLFCDRSWRVVHLVREMPPGRITRPVLKARWVLELGAGSAAAVEVGTALRLEDQSNLR